MRLLAVGLALAVLLALAPPTRAAMDHDTVASGTLTAGSSTTLSLGFSGGPLFTGWVFILVAKTSGGTLTARLSAQGIVAHDWTIPPSERWYGTTMLPQDSFYDLTLTNPGTTDVTYAFYFDQSCECQSKFVPSEIPNGFVIFNTEAAGAASVVGHFTQPKAMTLKVTAAILTNQRALWPTDFQQLAVADTPTRHQQGGVTLWIYDVPVSVSEKKRVYFFVEGVSFNQSAYLSNDDLYLSAYYDVTPAGSGFPIPGTWLIAGAGVAFAAAGVGLLWRRRRNSGWKEAKDRSKRTKGRKGEDVRSRRDGARDGRRTRGSQRRRRRS